jgi:molybdenum cofactor synthesis domain-containing protein
MVREAKVLTVSTSVAAGSREDRSGLALGAYLTDHGFEVTARKTVADGTGPVGGALLRLADGFAGLLVTTGGTGFSPTDLTPEATQSVVERLAPGLAEAMRAASPLGRLSRGVAGTLGACLIINLPGSPAGALESIGSVVDALPHALELLAGGHPH